MLQPCDLTINKVIKCSLRKSFNNWHSIEITKQINTGMKPGKTKVDLRLTNIKIRHLLWVIDSINNIKKATVVNGFKKAGIKLLEKKCLKNFHFYYTI